eukprot:Trichotokara_eunicae@DN7082_c0_g1_i1.p1
MSGVVYRLAHEKSFERQLGLATSSATVAELKIVLAREVGFEKEFQKKFDIAVSVEGPKGKLELLEDDCDIVPAGSRIVVKRVPWNILNRIEHTAKKVLIDVDSLEFTGYNNKKKKSCPEDYVCHICKGLLEEPALVRCQKECNASVCGPCLDFYLQEFDVCFICNLPLIGTIVNKTLERMISAVNWDEYQVPQAKTELKQEIIKEEEFDD